MPYSYALTYAPRQQPVPVDRWPGTDNPARPELHVPPGGRDAFRRVVGTWGNEDLIENAFDLREYDPANEIELGPLTVRFQEVPHFTETFAMSIAASNGSGGRIVYGADSSPTDALKEFAHERGPDARRGDPPAPRAHRHARPPDAGGGGRTGARGGREAAGAHPHLGRARLGVGRRARPRRAFGGPVEVAAGGDVYEV